LMEIASKVADKPVHLLEWV